MWEWIADHAEKLGMAIIAMGGVAAAAWQWLLKTRVESAKTGADVAIAQSQREVYDQMKERLTDLALQVERLTAKMDEMHLQLRERDDKIHKMELHIKDLETTLRQHGIDPPTMRY